MFRPIDLSPIFKPLEVHSKLNLRQECPIALEKFENLIYESIVKKHVPYLLAFVPDSNEHADFYDGRSFYSWTLQELKQGRLAIDPCSRQACFKIHYFILKSFDEEFELLKQSPAELYPEFFHTTLIEQQRIAMATKAASAILHEEDYDSDIDNAEEQADRQVPINGDYEDMPDLW